MRATRVHLGMILVAIVVAASPAIERQVTAQARQRAFYVGVVDGAGIPAPDLGVKDFIVKEDNVAREILKVEPAVDPMQVAVLVDTSQQARNLIAHMRAGLPPFFAALTNPNAAGAKNEVALIAFGERPTILTDYTTSAAALDKGMGRVWAQQGSGPYLVDAVFETAKAFKKREAARPIIVAIATEGGELSYRREQETLQALFDAGAALHTLMIGTPSSSMTDEARSRNIVLDRGTSETGGFRDQLLSANALPDRLKRLADQLTHQYKVTYARPDRLIPAEKITIAAANPALTAHGVLVKEEKIDKARP